MSLLQSGFADDYLEAYHDGKIKKGLDVGIPELDHHIRYKQGQFVMVNGADNVGKTAWVLWYFLCLSIKHKITWCVWSGENKTVSLVRQLIEFRSGRKLKELNKVDMHNYKAEIQEYFKWVDTKQEYTAEELFEIFKNSGCNGCLIDPYTGLKRGFQHSDNYGFLNACRNFVNSTNITLYVNTHPNTEAARKFYPMGHEFEYSLKPPMKSEVEGGQSFANRPDDFITIHRLTENKEKYQETWVFIRKVKDNETGGQPTFLEDPIIFDWNKGCGFVCYGQNPLSKIVHEHRKSVNLPQDEESDLPF